MQQSMELLSAFAIGFLGSLHCVAMCGGISSTLTNSPPMGQDKSSSLAILQSKLIYPLLYSGGRITSYMAAGAIAGTSGLIFAKTGGEGTSGLRIFAGAMMILLGLYITGWWNFLTHIEKAGKHVWQKLAPITRKLVPANNPFKVLALGALWGWLPCGLVYSALTWSMGSGDPARGALLMGFFGLGTLPAIFGTAIFGGFLFNFAKARSSRIVAGVMIIGFGFWTISGAVYHGSGSHHHHESDSHNRNVPHQMNPVPAPGSGIDHSHH